jgi:hypothetical protein
MDEQKFWDEADNTLRLVIEYDLDKWSDLDEMDIPLIVDIPFNMDDSDFVGILDLSDLTPEDWHNDPNTHNYV